jgi:hypothetical protein
MPWTSKETKRVRQTRRVRCYRVTQVGGSITVERPKREEAIANREEEKAFKGVVGIGGRIGRRDMDMAGENVFIVPSFSSMRKEKSLQEV